MQESSCTKLLEHTSVSQESCRKTRDLCTRRQGGDQDTAAIVRDKNEPSRLKILLGFSLCFFFFSSFFLGLNFFLLPLLHLTFSLQLPEQVPAPFLQRGNSCNSKLQR